MDFTSHLPAILGVVAFMLLCNLLWGRKRAGNLKGTLPPEASGGWPIIGHLHLLGGPKTLARTLAAMADKHGPIFTVRIGKHRTLLISSYEAMKQSYTTNDRVLSSRPSSTQGKYLGYDHTLFALAPYGSLWRDVRKLIMVELLSAHKVKLFKDVQLSEVNMSIKELYLQCKINEHGSIKINMSEWLEHLTLNVITKIVAGKRVFESNSHGNDKGGRPIGKIMQEYIGLLGVNVPSDTIPFLGWLDYFQGIVKSMKSIAREFDEIMDNWIEEHKLKKLNGDTKKDQDFIDVMLSKLEDEYTHGVPREIIMKGNILSMIAGGSDTTTLAMTWILSNLLNKTSTLERAQEEIDLKVGKDRCLEDSDVQNLVYFQAIIKETLRLYPPGPLGLPRETTEDAVVGGYYVPKGTRMMANYWKLHRDPNVWSNPDDFIPERFLTTHANVDISGHNFELLPFGSGRRSCPGMSFAMQTMHLTLTRLLQAFTLTTPPNEPVDMTEAISIVLAKKTPLEVVLTPRLSPVLY